MPDTRDPRTLRLYDVQEHEHVEVHCHCGHIVHFLPGTLQRLRRLPSDTLMYDLQYRLRCEHCNNVSVFRIGVVDRRGIEAPGGAKSEIVVVDGLPLDCGGP